MPELPGRNLQARYNICPSTTRTMARIYTYVRTISASRRALSARLSLSRQYQMAALHRTAALCRGRVREIDPDMLRWHVGIPCSSKEGVSPLCTAPHCALPALVKQQPDSPS
jgi:hypothetical protein